MTSAIHYKVKSGGVGAAAGGGGGGWQSIHFDGVYLPCHELKRRIIYNEGWCTSEHDANFDLQVSNSSSGEGERRRGEREDRRRAEREAQTRGRSFGHLTIDALDL